MSLSRGDIISKNTAQIVLAPTLPMPLAQHHRFRKLELVLSRCCAPEMILTRHPLNSGLTAFTFVNAPLALLTRVDGEFRNCSLTFVNELLTVVNELWTADVGPMTRSFAVECA